MEEGNEREKKEKREEVSRYDRRKQDVLLVWVRVSEDEGMREMLEG